MKEYDSNTYLDKNVLEHILATKEEIIINSMKDMRKHQINIFSTLNKINMKYKVYTDNYSSFYYDYDMLVLSLGNIPFLDIMCFFIIKKDNFLTSLKCNDYIIININNKKGFIKISYNK
ncbi:hypothetical protein SAMN05660772_00911 [Pasteurella testudinis DSM 23072]|uniref:Uncharacterized protein n=1 Tax=Pasteurella testudinis DSM 23072 TaxID=1122938 RepID=A0A1W1UZW9_9PAST|nr:hypothetical protein [Pasteurella testudinis]SMB86606.1 hypothetical protein SAMN05660772_00911 [Pasteurella testudinis DSM 23072]SUB51830.1 Uncharacterised protein [Pasteurella testudinis]